MFTVNRAHEGIHRIGASRSSGRLFLMPGNQINQTKRQARTSGGGSADPRQAVETAVDEAKGAVEGASAAIGDAASGAREAVGALASEAQSIAAEAGE
jgi:hypothetical protein